MNATVTSLTARRRSTVKDGIDYREAAVIAAYLTAELNHDAKAKADALGEARLIDAARPDGPRLLDQLRTYKAVA